MSEENGSPQGGNPAAAGGDAPWFDGFQDTSIKEWTAAKGWKSAESAAQSAWHLEKLLGADKAGRGVIWPKDETDTNGWNEVYKRLGRPDSPDGYEVKLPDGTDDSYMKHMLPLMHKAGVPKARMQEILEGHESFASAFHERQEQEWSEKSNQQFEALNKEWGGDFAKNSEMARRAIAVVGLNKEQAEAIERAIGVDTAAKVFAEFGRSYMEHASPGHFNTGSDSKTSAQARIQELKGDMEFTNKLLNGDATAKMEWDRLHKIGFS